MVFSGYSTYSSDRKVFAKKCNMYFAGTSILRISQPTVKLEMAGRELGDNGGTRVYDTGGGGKNS